MATVWNTGDRAKFMRPWGPDSPNAPPLRVGAVFPVLGVHVCVCGIVSLDIGLGLDSDSLGVDCPCGTKTDPSNGIRWCGAFRFVKEETTTKKEQLEQAIADENFELAAKILKEP